jgi:hypothetical protein
MEICFVTTSQTDHGETARRKYVSFGEFIFCQFENFKFSCAQLSLRIFKIRHGRCFSLSKIIPVRFFILQLRYRNPKRHTYRKKSKCTPSQPFCASIYAFSRTSCVLCLYNYAFFFERENEAFVHRCAQGPSLSNFVCLDRLCSIWK